MYEVGCPGGERPVTEHFTYTPPSDGWPPQHPPYPQQYAPQYQSPYGPVYDLSSEPPQRRRRGGRMAAVVGGGLLLLLLGGAGGFAAGWSAHPAATAQTSPFLPLSPGTGNGTGGQTGGGFGSGSDGSSGSSGADGSGSTATGAGGPTDAQISAVAAKVDPALVDINTVLGAQNGEAAGTGIVIGASGVILTNNHVVAGATSISVTDLGNSKTYRAAVVGYDRSGDVAVLQLSGASGLATATLSTSTVKAGDQVVAIGNAGGTGGTPSAVGGVVSALNQSITASDESSGSSEQLTGLIEVNAAIQAGDSGGPLLTTSGQVIGMDTAASAGFQYQASGGDGYAIPIGNATTIADQIRAGKSSSVVHIGATAYLGIETTSSNRSTGGATGPVVLGVVQGSPAESAGLSRGDVITSISGTAVDTATALTTKLDGYHPGDSVKVAYTDLSGQSHTSTVKLATGPVG
jgi:S1-C subfamily serine protease